MPNPPTPRIDPKSPEWPFYDPLPFEPVVLRDLILHLDNLGVIRYENNQWDVSRCDHTLSKTRAFLSGQADPDAAVGWVSMHGAGCDCEVLLNVAPKYEEVFGPIE